MLAPQTLGSVLGHLPPLGGISCLGEPRLQPAVRPGKCVVVVGGSALRVQHNSNSDCSSNKYRTPWEEGRTGSPRWADCRCAVQRRWGGKINTQCWLASRQAGLGCRCWFTFPPFGCSCLLRRRRVVTVYLQEAHPCPTDTSLQEKLLLPVFLLSSYLHSFSIPLVLSLPEQRVPDFR